MYTPTVTQNHLQGGYKPIPYLTSRFHHIPITNDHNQLIGMVTQSDLIEFLYNLKQ
ncbi:CBS domain-containing protein [Vibrio furnissii]|uniref:CBS domain-containing protein n=1 Tax=Vibrio furnissii TaxID=29494 RepID=UPI0025747F9B|nr:CBS domain-containing protein [Vibrio furnissii]WJG29206.1 CBS domain-containing protein [Vibrio furnissii]